MPQGPVTIPTFDDPMNPTGGMAPPMAVEASPRNAPSKFGLPVRSIYEDLTPGLAYLKDQVAQTFNTRLRRDWAFKPENLGKTTAELDNEVAAEHFAQWSMGMAEQGQGMSDEEYGAAIDEALSYMGPQPAMGADPGLEAPNAYQTGLSLLVGAGSPNPFAAAAVPYQYQGAERDKAIAKALSQFKFDTDAYQTRAGVAERMIGEAGANSRAKAERELKRDLSEAELAQKEIEELARSRNQKDQRAGALITRITSANTPGDATLAWEELQTLDPARAARYKGTVDRIEKAVGEQWDLSQSKVQAEIDVKRQTYEKMKALLPKQLQSADLANELARWKVRLAPWQEDLMKERLKTAELYNEYYPQLSETLIEDRVWRRQMDSFQAAIASARLEQANQRLAWDQSEAARREFIDARGEFTRYAEFMAKETGDEITELRELAKKAKGDKAKAIQTQIARLEKDRGEWQGKARPEPNPTSLASSPGVAAPTIPVPSSGGDRGASVSWQRGADGVLRQVQASTGGSSRGASADYTRGGRRLSRSGPEIAARAAKAAGFGGENLVTAVAIAMAESRGDPGAANQTAATKDDSHGLWQVNYFGDLRAARTEKFGPPEAQYDPATNAKAAYQISGGRNFSAWTTFRNGAYKKYLQAARDAVARLKE